MNMPKLPKIVKSSITDKTQPVKVHKQPMTKREYERVTDIRNYLSVIEKHGDRIAFTYFEKGRQLKDVTYGELAEQVKRVAAGFKSLGLKGSRIAIIGETSVAWISTYLAAMVEGHVVIPMDKELEISQIEGFLESVDADVIVYSALFNKKFSEAKLNHKTLRTFVAIAPDEEELAGEKTISFASLIERGTAAIDAGYEYPSVENRDALAELLFTSGTTGTSKKVMLSQTNIFSVVTAAAATVDFKPDDTIVSVLPIHHTYELACILAGLDYGMHICINDSLTRVLKNFQIFKPTGLVLVPLFIYTIYKKIWAEAKKTGRDKKLKVGIGASRAMRAVGIDKRRELFADVVEAFGGRLEKIICGGAALNPKMIEFFDNIGITICEGFGITECAPLTCVAPYYARKFGSVGPAVPCCQVRIVGDMKNERGYIEGEIQVKGDNVMLGYYDNPEATAEVFTEDGWFRTGDMGYMDEDQYVYITGRLKSVIVLENGKNIFPEEIEEYLGNIDEIAESVVVGRHTETDTVNLVAIVYPDRTKFPEDATEDMIRDHIWALISELNKTLPTYKHIMALEMRDTEFEKTTSKKIKRHLVK